MGNPYELTVKELAEKIIESLKSSSDIVYLEALIDDPKQRCPDISLAKKVLDWAPKVDFETGLSNTAEYFKSMV